MARAIRKLMSALLVLVFFIVISPVLYFYREELLSLFKNQKPLSKKETENPFPTSPDGKAYWIAPKLDDSKDAILHYGRSLIENTSAYLGPKGSVASISNGMNCQNCHLDAGTRIYGNNFGSVYSTYPKLRARSGKIEDIYKRVNDCFERSLNGTALDTASKEMQAIKAYIEFLGSDVPKGQQALGSGLKALDYLDRAADPKKGKLVYDAKCLSCHQADGHGLMNPEGNAHLYPPLWGPDSYNDGAGLYRISTFAKYVKYNMPLGVTFDKPQLTDEEAWDVAAFVNNQARPHKNVPSDWPDKSKKPVDYPFGPYSDKFSEKQHKFGPFKPIEQVH